MKLINADELREQIDDCKYFDSSFQKMTVAEFLTIVHDLIDNAEEIIPFATVETQTFREYERPQGKWLNDRVAFHFTCDYCGCNIRQLKSEVFEGDYDYNFCPNCGAEMEKGGEEE